MRTFSLLLFSYPVVPTSLWPHGLQHGRPACPSPIPRACRSSCSLHWWCRPAISSSHVLFSFCPWSFPAAELFQWVIYLHQMTKILKLQPQHQAFQWIFRVDFSEYSGLISLKTDWFHLLAVQGTIRSLLKQRSSKASIIPHTAFFMVQFSQPYVTTGKTIALTIRTFVGRVIMFLLFNTLSRFAICFLPRSNHLIPWLQSPSIVISEPKKRKSITASTFPPSICHAVMGPDAIILVLIFSPKSALQEII